jgi:hypothetical protein
MTLKNLLFLFYFAGLISCIKISENKSSQFIQISSGKAISTDCKIHIIASTDFDSDYISYSYHNQVLHITHINAAFNCCPGGIHYNSNAGSDSIVINEMEEVPGCNCECLYDVDYDLAGIPKGTYLIHIIEHYKQDNDLPLSVRIKLTEGSTGKIGLPRTSYPWGTH